MGKSTKIPVSFRFTEDEQGLLDRVAERFGGNKTKAVVEGLTAFLRQDEPSDDLLLAILERRLKGRNLPMVQMTAADTIALPPKKKKRG